MFLRSSTRKKNGKEHRYWLSKAFDNQYLKVEVMRSAELGRLKRRALVRGELNITTRSQESAGAYPRDGSDSFWSSVGRSSPTPLSSWRDWLPGRGEWLW